MLSRFERIKRLREGMQSRDYDVGVSTVHSGDLHELLALARQRQKLLEAALANEIDDEWSAGGKLENGYKNNPHQQATLLKD